MTSDRGSRAWESINACARREGVAVSIRHVCVACVQAVAADGAGLSMARGRLREPVFAIDQRSEELEELQFTLGEGPGVDALGAHRAVLAADLSAAESARRWPVFAVAAVMGGVRAMFSVPVHAGAARFGVLDLYRDRAGPLTGGQLADTFAYADAALVIALDQRGGISPKMEEFFDAEFAGRRAQVHQAAGMVMVQTDVAVADALAQLRAYAYSHGLRLADVAADVVGRRLRLPADDAASGPSGRRQNGCSPYGGAGQADTGTGQQETRQLDGGEEGAR